MSAASILFQAVSSCFLPTCTGHVNFLAREDTAPLCAEGGEAGEQDTAEPSSGSQLESSRKNEQLQTRPNPQASFISICPHPLLLPDLSNGAKHLLSIP